MKTKIIKAKSFYTLLILLVINFVTHAQTFKKPPVYVLVHGAWHGGWCWQKVSDKLLGNGDVVYTPTLSGMAERKDKLNQQIDLNTHITDIVELIKKEDLHNVILVGHSYAGAVIAGVADRIPDRLSKLVFLDAMLVRNGQSPLSVSSPDSQKNLIKAAANFDGGLSVPAFPAEAFGITDRKDVAWVNARVSSQPLNTFKQRLTLKHVYGNHLPLIYIACTSPQMPAIKPFADETRSGKGWKYLELRTGHDAMVTEPEMLAEMLQSLL
jgi:pimeloyl-ACP methyl ester carboxylesterase